MPEPPFHFQGMIQDLINKIRPSVSSRLESDETGIMNLWSAADVGSFFWDTYEELAGPDPVFQIGTFQPLGTFICGDIVCTSRGGRIFIIDHDSFDVTLTSVNLAEFVELVLKRDPDLERHVSSRWEMCIRGRRDE